MNVLIEKYKNCCKFCFGPNQDLITLGTKELEDVEVIKELMGAEITNENADYAKVIKNAVCFKCASNLIVFRNFRIQCNEKLNVFKKEFEQVQKSPKEVIPQKFVCEFCLEYYDSEGILSTHKMQNHRNEPSAFSEPMEIDTSCNREQNLNNISEDGTSCSEIDYNENKITEYYECNDCHRKFLPEDHAIYLAHCRNVHQKKVPCPFGCLVTPMDKENPVRPKRKLFKNLYYLANHLQKQHFDVVKQETLS